MQNETITYVLRVQDGSGKSEPLRFTLRKDGTLGIAGDPCAPIDVLRRDPNGFTTVLWNQRVISGVISSEGERGELLHVTEHGETTILKVSDAHLDAMEAGLRAASPDNGLFELNTPIPGLVKTIQAELNAVVEAGQTIVVLEAMKMENDIVAPHRGTLAAIAVKPGQAVAAGALLATIKIKA